MRLFHDGALRAPFVYGFDREIDMLTTQRIYTPNRELIHPIRLFVRGEPYRFWGLFETDLHLFGAEGTTLLLMGSDSFGRDMFTRNLYAARISGYYGGTVDMAIQRLIEFLIALPTIPVWMALAAALPPGWESVKIYFGITIILSIVGWTGLARVVRGKLLELREADFVMAARVAGAHEGRIIALHLLPSFLSYLIVHLTLAIPGMILGETALSFLGLGIRPPAVSWGTLLQDAQNVQTVILYPWLMLPALSVVAAVLMFNFLGDGLRDAADPYKTR